MNDKITKWEIVHKLNIRLNFFSFVYTFGFKSLTLSIRYASLALRNASRDGCISSGGIRSMSLGE